MNCDKVRNELKAYLDNELNFINKWIIARHIKYCDDCKLEMKAMESISNEIKDSQEFKAPESLQAKVLSNIKFNAVEQKTYKRKKAVIYSLSSVAVVLIIALVASPVFYKTIDKARIADVSPDSELVAGTSPASPQVVAKKSADKLRTLGYMGSNAEVAGESNLYSGKRGSGMSLPAMEPMIIKNADISIRVRDFDTAFNKIVFICKSNRGYIVSTSSSLNGKKMTNGQISFRIPNYRFEQTIQKLSELGKITSNNISGDDVSGEVVDLESNLRNKRAEEKQYLIIMERAKRISDVITVTNELTRVRGEIDQIQGRIKYLKDSVSMSTINVELYEKIQKTKSEDKGLGRVFKNAFSSFVSSLKSLASILIWILVFSPFVIVPVIIWLVIKHRHGKTKQ